MAEVLGLEARVDPGAGIAESGQTNNAATAELLVELVSRRAAMATDRISFGSYAVNAELAEAGVVRVRAVSSISIAADVRVAATLLADRRSYARHETAHLSGAVINAGADNVGTSERRSRHISNSTWKNPSRYIFSGRYLR